VSHFADFRVITKVGAVRANSGGPTSRPSADGGNVAENVHFVSQDGDECASVNVNFVWTIAAATTGGSTSARPAEDVAIIGRRGDDWRMRIGG
jgi:hypothetical protein